MKTIKFGIILTTLTLLVSSCEDFLDVQSPSAFDADYVFSNEADARKMILGAYALFGEDSYTSRMSAVWMQNTDVEAISLSTAPPTPNHRNSIFGLMGGTLSGFGDVYSAWNHNYLAIDRANQCIEGIQNSSIKDRPLMKHMLGEMYCLRAYRYFLLCNFWGDVPYFTKAAKGGMELDVPKTDKNIIYTGCIQDLINTEEGMMFSSTSPDGIERMNRDFALGMIARLSLFRAGYGMTKDGLMKRADDYLNLQADSLAVTYTINGITKTARTSTEYFQLAKDYCQKFIDLKDRPLNPKFAEVFSNQNMLIKPLNGDVLYEVSFVAGFGGDVGWCIGTTNNPAGLFGSTTIQVYLTPTYFLSFDDKDIRRDVTVGLVGYSGDLEKSRPITALDVNKWSRRNLNNPGAASSKGTGVNWPLMRYSDILLMLAEADNELNGGPTELGRTMLKRVRARAFNSADHAAKVDDYTNALGSKQDFFNAIVDERAWEFGGECLRKFDLVRWNIYGQKILDTKNSLTNIAKAARGVELGTPDVDKYVSLADYIYYKKVNGKLIFLNTKYKLPDANVPTSDLLVSSDDIELAGNENKFVRVDWCKTFGELSSGAWTPNSYVTNNWYGFNGNSNADAVPYLIAISSQITGASKYLTNDGYKLAQ